MTSAPATVELGVAPQVGEGRRLLLHLDDLRVAAGQAAILRVFVGRPDATASTPADDPGFVDELFLVPSGSTPAAPGAYEPGRNLTLPLPAGALEGGEPIVVTLVPARADADGRLTEPGDVELTLKPPYVTAEP
jgi:hypothetical protein